MEQIFSVQGMKPDLIKIQAFTGPSNSTDTKTATAIPQISELPTILHTRYSQQNNICPRTNFTMGQEPLNRQLFPKVKAMDLQYTPTNNPCIL